MGDVVCSAAAVALALRGDPAVLTAVEEEDERAEIAHLLLTVADACIAAADLIAGY